MFVISDYTISSGSLPAHHKQRNIPVMDHQRSAQWYVWSAEKGLMAVRISH